MRSMKEKGGRDSLQRTSDGEMRGVWGLDAYFNGKKKPKADCSSSTLASMDKPSGKNSLLGNSSGRSAVFYLWEVLGPA